MPLKEKTMEIKLNQIDVQKLNLQDGDVLMVKMKGDDFCSVEILNSLKNELQLIFPNNRVSVLCMPSDHDIAFDVVASQKETASACGPGPANYCNDCGCGKKEAYERKQGE